MTYLTPLNINSEMVSRVGAQTLSSDRKALPIENSSGRKLSRSIRELTLLDGSAEEGRLRELVQLVASFSMHLPAGFASNLSKQLSFMMSPDVWDESDRLPALVSLKTLMNIIRLLGILRKPGLGSNGRGSITAFWTSGRNEMTLDFLPDGSAVWFVKIFPKIGDAIIESSRGDPSTSPFLKSRLVREAFFV